MHGRGHAVENECRTRVVVHYDSHDGSAIRTKCVTRFEASGNETRSTLLEHTFDRMWW